MTIYRWALHKQDERRVHRAMKKPLGICVLHIHPSIGEMTITQLLNNNSEKVSKILVTVLKQPVQQALNITCLC
jgi:phage replication-related protein YjqB (UPF0714/DUF867 family)